MSESVVLDLPLHLRHASTGRTLGASLAADNGFSLDAIDDLRLAVNEVISVLADVGGPRPAGRMRLRFDLSAAQITVAGHRNGEVEPLRPDALDALASRILAAVVDDFSIDADGVFTIVKRNDSGIAGG
jgi:anti-sigma regulatory factor (Ser/Thr protein kinase)